jgi:hypothetical protein
MPSASGISEFYYCSINVSSFQNEVSLIIEIYKHLFSLQSMTAKPLHVYKEQQTKAIPDPEGVIHLLNYPV